MIFRQNGFFKMNQKYFCLIVFLLCFSFALSEEPRPILHSILYVGDSITKHSPSEKLGWKNEWGMAATTLSNDYVHQFSGKVAQAQGAELTTIVHAVGGGTVAGKLADAASLSELRADLIVIQLGENDNKVSSDEFEKTYEELGKMLQKNNPQSKVICLGTWGQPSGNAIKDERIQKVCARNAWAFASLKAANADPAGAAKATGLWAHPGVGWHPSDIGMTAYAEALWKAYTSGAQVSAATAVEPAPVKAVVEKGPLFLESFEVKEIGDLKWATPNPGVLVAGEKGKALQLISPKATSSVYSVMVLNPELLVGKNIVLTARVRADNVSAKAKSYQGIKLGFSFLDAEGHKDYPQAVCETGTFEWKTVRLEIHIPDNLVKASLRIGLEAVSGSVTFDDITITTEGK
jgi:lysophospholipase L1-like esterase